MGRFDLLTQLDKRQSPPQSSSSVAEPLKPPPFPDNAIAGKPANTQTSKDASMQTGKPVNIQTGLHANPQTGKPTNIQTSKDASMQTGKPAFIEKYSTYLTPECKKGLRRIAFESDRKDYEVLIEAVEQYLERQKLQK